MAAAIYENAKILDDESGTEYAKSLTSEDLSHTNYSNLDSKLPTSKDQSKNIVTQRNNMAEALFNINNILAGANKVAASTDTAAFKKIDQYDSSIKGVATQLDTMIKNKLIEKQNDLMEQLIALVSLNLR